MKTIKKINGLGPSSPADPDSKLVRRRSGGGSALLSRRELSEKLGISVRSIDRMVSARKIPAIRVAGGRLLRFRLEAVLAALDKNSTTEAL